MTFEERYCRRHTCAPDAFRRKLFWRALPPSRRPVAVMLRWVRPRYFVSDDAFIHGISMARTLDEVRRAAQSFHDSGRTEGWWRRVARVRISARRIVRLAHRYIPDS